MSRFAENRKLIEALSRFERVLPETVSKMGNIALNHFKSSWRTQGFTDRNVKRWPARKKEDKKRLGRAILVKSGRLRRSLRRVPFGRFGVVIKTDVPYAEIHNEGGTIKHGTRAGLLSFNGGRLARTRTERQRQRVTQQIPFVRGASETKMPQRQFMGDSKVMEGKIEQMIDAQIRKTFK